MDEKNTDLTTLTCCHTCRGSKICISSDGFKYHGRFINRCLSLVGTLGAWSTWTIVKDFVDV